jgi:Concanavalin A-like lectin/glucanases superfamily
MKRKLLGKTLKQTFLAVPAAALMLGASQGQTTVGLNFQAWYYDSGNTPQTVGYGSGYQTTGFPVTARAFGIDPANWFNPDPLPCSATISDNVTFAGTLTAQINAPNAWQSGIGEQVAGWNPETVAPGNNEVTWGYLDDGNTTGESPSVSVSGLAAIFPNGYVVQTIAAENGSTTFDPVNITDGSTTNTVAYSTYYVASPASDGADFGGTVGLSVPSGTFTSDTINIDCQPKTSGSRSTLAGFIITDQPVVSLDPVGGTNDQGSSLVLTAGAIGIPPLSYQWRLNGSPIPGATSSSYTNSSLTSADAGNYDLVVTNLYGATTSAVAVVAIQLKPLFVTDLSSTTNSTYIGFSPMLSVVARGANPLSYQWEMNGTPVVGATNASITVSNLTVGVSGYNVVVTNIYGMIASETDYLNAVTAPDVYTTKVGQDAPTSYWPLNEVAGSIAHDYSGYGHDGEQTNGLTLGVSGPQPPTFPGFSTGKTAYQFDGASGYIACGTNASLSGTTDFTVEAWIKTTATTAGDIVCQRDPNGYIGEYECTMNANGTLAFYIYGSGYQFDFTSSKTVNDGNWHYVVFVRNGETGIIYIDGANVASASGTVQALGPTLQTYIGANVRDNDQYFDGAMANVAIYNHALTPGQIITHYITGTGVPLTIAMIPGGVIQDEKPAGTLHDGLNFSTTWLTNSTDYNNVTRNGVEQFTEAKNSQITIPPDDADFNSTNGTICFWVNYLFPIAGLPGSGNEGATLFDHRTSNGAVIVLNSTSGSIEFQAIKDTNGVPNGNFTLAGSSYVADGNWHHVTITYDQSSNGVVSLYVDGVLDTSQPNPSAWSWPTNQEIELGRSHDSYWYVYDGQMDDFRIYNRILTPTEISTIATEGTSDTLVDTNALMVRFNFDSAPSGNSIVWPYGVLQSSPVLGPGAVWTTLTNAVSPQPVLIDPAKPQIFYRSTFTP